MRISQPRDALKLPLGTLEVVTQQDQGRVCRVCSFSKDDVVAITDKLLNERIELNDFIAQAEIVSFMINRFGWKDYREAFALDVAK
ncbi:hypothetical protein AAFG07_33390 [Bradyrhizobium sp. B097]|uniref:hypothetical protein n=1 Tax=Bradyrhizobium sp. B097 TaxID=3140244 RepID=UPI003183D937